MNNRGKVTIIFTVLKSGPALHFCGHSLLSGANNDLWFPVSPESSIFNAIENIMVDNNQAHNVVEVKELRASGEHCFDYEVIYNKLQ